MARSMRTPILVTWETSSSENSFFSRVLRNLSPNAPTWFVGCWQHHRTTEVGLPLPRGLAWGNQCGGRQRGVRSKSPPSHDKRDKGGALTLRQYLERDVAVERGSWSDDPDGAGRGAGGYGRGDFGCGHDCECGCGAVEGDSGRSGE